MTPPLYVAVVGDKPRLDTLAPSPLEALVRLAMDRSGFGFLSAAEVTAKLRTAQASATIKPVSMRLGRAMKVLVEKEPTP